MRQEKADSVISLYRLYYIDLVISYNTFTREFSQSDSHIFTTITKKKIKKHYQRGITDDLLRY